MKGSIVRLATFYTSPVKTISLAVVANGMTVLLLGSAYGVGTVSQISAVFFFYYSLIQCKVEN